VDYTPQGPKNPNQLEFIGFGLSRGLLPRLAKPLVVVKKTRFTMTLARMIASWNEA
jgi:hypothetical protein